MTGDPRDVPADEIFTSPLSRSFPVAVHHLLHPDRPPPASLLAAADAETLLVETDLYHPPAGAAQLEAALRRLRAVLRDADAIRRATVRSALLARLRAGELADADGLASAAVPRPGHGRPARVRVKAG